MRTISDINFQGKKVLIRVDFNVPLSKDFKVTDNTRIKAAIPTLEKVINDGGSVVLMSHLGRPKSGPEDNYSLRHIVSELEKLLEKKVLFINDCISKEGIEATQNLQNGEIALLENLRFYKEETEGSVEFAQQLSKHGDVYINDAFGTAHRAHASTAIIAQFFPEDKYFGFLLENEIKNIDALLTNPKSPTLAIIGGAKVSSKISIIENLMDTVDEIIIGGGMAYTFVKANGGKVGDSLVEEEFIDTALKIMDLAKKKDVKLHLPIDTIIADKFSNDATIQTSSIDAISLGWMGLDIGEKTIENFSQIIENAKTILWNGPMGVFEMENFKKGTESIANALVKATEKGAFTLIGGGDSVAAINKLNLADKVSYVSTGGGAMLEYLEGIELPGIKAIRE